MTRTRLIPTLAAVAALLMACGDGGEPGAPAAAGSDAAAGCIEDFDENVDYFPEKVTAEHSQLWSAEYHPSYVVLSVPNSEFEDRGTLDYVLVRCGAPEPDLPAALAEAQVFEVPLRRTVINHGNGVAMLDEIDAVETVVGFGDSVFSVADDPWVAEIVERADDPVNVGGGDGVDLETTLGLEPDIVILGGFGPGFTNVADTVERGLPAVMISNRIESTPLASAEWIKFLAPFYGTEEKANERFSEIESVYEETAQTVRASLEDDFRAGYFCMDPDRGCEFMAGHGPSSLNGHILDTLGTTNVFAEGNDRPNGMGFDYESALGRAADADFFVIYDRLSIIEGLLESDARFSEFDALASGRFVGFLDGEYPRCRFTSTVQADLLIRDYAIGMVPDQFGDQEPTCFASPDRNN